jgi:hypothetical protein
MVELVSFELREKYLLVVGHGKRDDIATMERASALILAKAKETMTSSLLVDYRDLVINVKLSEAFNIVKHYEEAHPQLKNITIAGVFNPENTEFGKLWTEIGRKRGFTIEFFQDITIAEKWILDKQN